MILEFRPQSSNKVLTTKIQNRKSSDSDGTHTDKLKFQQQHVTSSDNTSGITKREDLREASRIYDPLGFLTPVTIRAKIKKSCYSWDQPLSQELQKKWLTLFEDSKTATQTEVSRRYFPS